MINSKLKEVKKITFIIIFTLIAFYINAQTTYPQGLPLRVGNFYNQSPGYFRVDSGFIQPRRDTLWTPTFPGTQVFWQNDGVDSAVWTFDGFQWDKGSSGGAPTTPSWNATMSVSANISSSYSSNFNSQDWEWDSISHFYINGKTLNGAHTTMQFESPNANISLNAFSGDDNNSFTSLSLTSSTAAMQFQDDNQSAILETATDEDGVVEVDLLPSTNRIKMQVDSVAGQFNVLWMDAAGYVHKGRNYRFGIEDNLGIQNRIVDMQNFYLKLTSGGFILGTGTVTAGQSDLSINTGAATGTGSIAGGSGVTVSGSNSISIGADNTLSADEASTFGSTNTNASTWSMISGFSNTANAGSGGYTFANTLLGLANTSGDLARGGVTLGGSNTVNNDFAIALGSANYSNAKASIAEGYNAFSTIFGGVALNSTVPVYSGQSAVPVGSVQTDIINFVNYQATAGNAHVLEAKVCADAAGNIQSCGQYFGDSYYTVRDSTICYVQGRLIGVTATGDVTVWTIDTWFKNVAGTITSGTSNFTNVTSDAAFATMNTATLSFSTITGTQKALRLAYTNTGTYPIAEYSCTLIINKLHFTP